mmetsp:Transcript_19345/g.42725  ORF Transcript_19345/g.42725 Transcript_19345/m.42725 type:complete len:214 (+) Transcript_19345:398-1039(+)
MLRVSPELVLKDIQDACGRCVFALGEHFSHVQLPHALDVHALLESGGEFFSKNVNEDFLLLKVHVGHVHLVHSLQARAGRSKTRIGHVSSISIQDLDHHGVGDFEPLGGPHHVHGTDVTGDALGSVLVALPVLVRKAIQVAALRVTLFRNGFDWACGFALAIPNVLRSDAFLLVAIKHVQVDLAGDLTGVVPGISTALQQKLEITIGRVQDLQ